VRLPRFQQAGSARGLLDCSASLAPVVASRHPPTPRVHPVLRRPRERPADEPATLVSVHVNWTPSWHPLVLLHADSSLPQRPIPNHMAKIQKRPARPLTLAPSGPGAYRRISAALRAFSTASGPASLAPPLAAPQDAPWAGPPTPISYGLGLPLDIRGVAELIGCSPWTVRQRLMPSGLPFFRFGASGKFIFYTNQVVRWIEARQKGGSTIK
jgi:hypothetical protein